jgi:lysophospholipase L1-like esterase
MVLLFIISEVCIRVIWHPHIIGQRLYTRFDAAYSYGFDSDQALWFKKNDGIYFYPTQYLNFHRQSIPVAKSPNDFRIFTFGGSVSRGLETGNYSYYLEKYLNAEYTDHHWSVINLSADGIGSQRMQFLLEKIFPLKPDLVILHVHGSNEYEDERDSAYRDEIHRGLNGIALQSRLLVLLKKIYVYLTPQDNASVSDADAEITASMDPSNRQRWIQTIDLNLSKMIARCHKWKVPVILVGRAEKLEGIYGYSSRWTIQINTILQKWTGAETTYFDTAAQFLKAYPKAQGKDLLFSDETHWTDYGHKIIAHELQIHIAKFTHLLQKLISNESSRSPKCFPE